MDGIEKEIYELQVMLQKELSEIRKLLIPIASYFAEKNMENKNDN